jgi:hypothetical protein
MKLNAEYTHTKFWITCILWFFVIVTAFGIVGGLGIIFGPEDDQGFEFEADDGS